MHDFKKLKVWNDGIGLVTDIYKVTSTFPKYEIYGLTSQIRRSAVSIPSNIAEGAGRTTNEQFKQFLNYAYGSCCELETQLIIAHNLTYLVTNDFNRLSSKLNEIQKMIFKLSSVLPDK